MSTKRCRNCGTDVGLSEYFCPACGEPMFTEEVKSEGYGGGNASAQPYLRQERTGGGHRASAGSGESPLHGVHDRPPEAPGGQGGASCPASRDAHPSAARIQAPTARSAHSRFTGPDKGRLPGGGTAAAGATNQRRESEYVISPSGARYSREELQRLVEEGRRRRKKALLVGIPGFLALAVAVILLVFLVFGGGMSPEEYREEAAGIHSGVREELERMKLDWDRVEVSDEPYSWWYERLRGDAKGLVVSSGHASTAVDELEPPEDVISLRDELASFYQGMLDYMLKAEVVFAFAQEWAATWEDWVTTPYAMEKVNEQMTPADIIALLDEDIAIIHDFVTRFKAISCPDECRNMLDGTLAMLEEEKGLIERLKRSLINLDIKAYEVVQDDYEWFDNSLEDRIVSLWEDLENFMGEFTSLVEQCDHIDMELKGFDEKMESDEQVTNAPHGNDRRKRTG